MKSWSRGATVGLLVKRALDLVAAVAVLVVCAPLFAAIALLVWLRLGRPVLYRQQRAGYRGRPFVLLKFRSMTEARDAAGTLRPDPERITTLGRWLRATSLDELPQLWNVLKGEMSLVGPRPLWREYLPFYTPEQARRHDVRPGFTGWAQVNGRRSINWKQKMDYDVWYVDHWSLILDLRILALTVRLVLSTKDSQPDGMIGEQASLVPPGFDMKLLMNTLDRGRAKAQAESARSADSTATC